MMHLILFLVYLVTEVMIRRGGGRRHGRRR
jgi:hypothetical protein